MVPGVRSVMDENNMPQTFAPGLRDYVTEVEQITLSHFTQKPYGHERYYRLMVGYVIRALTALHPGVTIRFTRKTPEATYECVDAVGAASYPFSGTKQTAILDPKIRSFVEENWCRYLPAVYNSFQKNEIRKVVDGVPKATHQISSLNVYSYLLQLSLYCDFFHALYDLGSTNRSWFAPGMTFLHGGADVFARRFLGYDTYVWLDFKKNNHTVGVDEWSWLFSELRQLFDVDDDTYLGITRVSYTGIEISSRGSVYDMPAKLQSGEYGTSIFTTLIVIARTLALVDELVGLRSQYDFCVYGDNILMAFREKVTHDDVDRACLKYGFDVERDVSSDFGQAEFLSHVFRHVVLEHSSGYCALPTSIVKVLSALSYCDSKYGPVEIASRFHAQLQRTAPDQQMYALVKLAFDRWLFTVDRSMPSALLDHYIGLCCLPRTYLAQIHVYRPE